MLSPQVYYSNFAEHQNFKIVQMVPWQSKLQIFVMEPFLHKCDIFLLGYLLSYPKDTDPKIGGGSGWGICFTFGICSLLWCFLPLKCPDIWKAVRSLHKIEFLKIEIVIFYWTFFFCFICCPFHSKWATSQENLSLGFATRIDSNQPAQPQKLAKRLEISDIASRGIILSRQWTTKVLIRLCGWAGWSSPLLFAYGKNRFSYDVAQIV